LILSRYIEIVAELRKFDEQIEGHKTVSECLQNLRIN
jgi:hypothetical protein